MASGSDAGGRGNTRGRKLEDVVDFGQPQVLGEGTFGTVYKAVLRASPWCSVAVKIIDKNRLVELMTDPQTVINEVEMMQLGAGEDKLVQLYDFLETWEKYFLVLELCGAGSLQDVASQGVFLGEPRVRNLVRQMTEAVAFLVTKGVCHRDVKPHNYMVVGDVRDDGVKVKLGDFGTATLMASNTLLTDVTGSPVFMAPEMHLLPDKSLGYDFKVDVWALGVCMIFLFANEYPFMDENGQLLQDQIIKGKVPIWDVGGFAGLFQRLGQVTGVCRKPPSRAAQKLIRKLLRTRRQKRPSAAEVLKQDWFAKPVQEETDTEGHPVLDWDEFQDGFSSVEHNVGTELKKLKKHVTRGLSLGAEIVADVKDMAEEVSRSSHSRPMKDGPKQQESQQQQQQQQVQKHSCVECNGTASYLDYTCPHCQRLCCTRCLGLDLSELRCPACKHTVVESSMGPLACFVYKDVKSIDSRGDRQCIVCQRPTSTSLSCAGCGTTKCAECKEGKKTCDYCGEAEGRGFQQVSGNSSDVGSEEFTTVVRAARPPKTIEAILDVPHKGLHPRALRCHHCHRESALMDHVCRRCQTSVCSTCVFDYYADKQECPRCREDVGNSMRVVRNAVQAKQSAENIWQGFLGLTGIFYECSTPRTQSGPEFMDVIDLQ